MKAWIRRPAVVGVLALVLMGMAGAIPAAAEKAPPLRVGVTPNYPPLIYRQGRRSSGWRRIWRSGSGRN